MAGTALARGMTPVVMPFIEIGSTRHQLAGQEEDMAVRALLREGRFGTGYQLSMEREPRAVGPDYAGGSEHQVLISKDRASGEIVGMGEWTVREHFINGKVKPVTYLSGLRLAAERRGAIAAVRSGYQAWKHFSGTGPGIAFTSIASDNHAALRLLTRGLPGFPVYRFCCDYVTLAIRPRTFIATGDIKPAKEKDLSELATFLNCEGRHHAFAPVWSEARLRGLAAFGLDARDFLVRRRGERITGCVALWDQRGFRQTRLWAYPRLIGGARPLLNRLGGMLRLPYLPQEGHILNQAVLSHLVSEDGDVADLVAAALDRAKARELSSVLLGSPEKDDRTIALRRRFGGLSYRSKIFLVHWPEFQMESDTLCLDAPHFELALL